MRLTIEIPDPVPPELLASITALLNRLGPGTSVETDDQWTVDRAVKLLRDVNARTLLLIEAAIEGNGWVDGPAFREKWGDKALRGPSQSLTKAIKRGAAQGHWPATIPHPLTPTTPDKEGWSKTGGYYLAEGLVQIFGEALRRKKEAALGPTQHRAD